MLVGFPSLRRALRFAFGPRFGFLAVVV
ncbi:hypothetical protein YWIDRAFT_06426, partial [Streptomyces sp. SceaMP-e96]